MAALTDAAMPGEERSSAWGTLIVRYIPDSCYYLSQRNNVFKNIREILTLYHFQNMKK